MQRNVASREVNQAIDSCDICPLPHNKLHRFSPETPDLMNFQTYGPHWQFDKDLLLEHLTRVWQKLSRDKSEDPH